MVHGHSHHHPVGADRPLVSAKVLRGLLVAVGCVALAVLVGMVLLWPSGDRPGVPEELGVGGDRHDATIRSVDVDPCQGTDPAASILCEVVAIEITSGAHDGVETTFELPVTDTRAADLEAGDRIVVVYDPSLPEGIQAGFADFQRRTPLVALLVIFVVAVLVLGRLQGLRALIALAITLVVLVGFLLPALLDGASPLAVALVSAGAIALVALYLTHGINDRTTVALLGTFGALALTGVLGAVFVRLTELTGFASEEALTLTALGSSVDIRGLLLAGIVIGSLGVLDDVTVTQVSAVWELHNANPELGFGRLYSAALRIGRDHIASTVNTLVLAYAGAALPLLLLYTQADQSLGTVVTAEVVAVEVVRTLVGSIGLVASVPITTALAAVVIAHPSVPGLHRSHDPEPPAPAGDAGVSASWDDFAPRA